MVVSLVEPPEIFDLPVTILVGGQPVQQTIRVPFLALEWMPTGDLGGQVSPVTSRTEFIVKLRLFRESCKSVRKLHARGIFHRDLKPENLLLDSNQRVRISDLGTARLVAPGVTPLLAAYAAPVGDLGYTAPEMLAGLHQDPSLFERADLYSLGLILHELLTGLPIHPFGDASLMKAHQFVQTMSVVPEAGRRALFEGFLDAQSSSAVPDLWVSNPQLPRCCGEPLQRLATGLAHFDFRRRLTDWDGIYRLVEICIRATQNEESYLRMLARRRK
jgi:serine/threonine protein kinase